MGHLLCLKEVIMSVATVALARNQFLRTLPVPSQSSPSARRILIDRFSVVCQENSRAALITNKPSNSSSQLEGVPFIRSPIVQYHLCLSAIS
jgi:hypothetical protein